MADENLIKLANEFRAQLLNRERKAAVRMVETYGHIYGRLIRKIAVINQQIEDARARGEMVNQAWLLRQERYAALLRQVDQEFKRFARIAEVGIAKQQSVAINAALSDSVALMAAAADEAVVAASFNRLPTAAVENMVGMLGNGSPLGTLLNQLPGSGRRIVEQGLVEAVALGIGPAATARKIREGLGGNLTRALTIARTETLRAYRTASSQTYQANSDVVQGWYWRSARGRRSCAACIAMDGTFHKVGEPMKAHPRCRCVQIPAVKGVEVDKGADWFETQPAETQRAIFNTKVGYRAYKSGELKLEDFVGLNQSAIWGDSYHQLSVRRALAGEGRFPRDAAMPRDPISPIFQPALAAQASTLEPIRKAELDAWIKSLTPAQRKALQEYTGQYADVINTRLRAGRELEPELVKRVKLIDKAMDKFELQRDATLYRGVGRRIWAQGIEDGSIRPGSTVMDLGYSSTSTDEAVARLPEFGSVILRISAPKGTKGAPLMRKSVSVFGDEQKEFLLPRGSGFQVKTISRQGDRTFVDVDLVPAAKETAKTIGKVKKITTEPRPPAKRVTRKEPASDLGLRFPSTVEKLIAEGKPLTAERLNISARQPDRSRALKTGKKAEIDIQRIQLGQALLDPARLNRALESLQSGVKSGRGVGAIEVMPDPDREGFFVVLDEGAHRVAALQLAGFKGEIPVKLFGLKKAAALKPKKEAKPKAPPKPKAPTKPKTTPKPRVAAKPKTEPGPMIRAKLEEIMAKFDPELSALSRERNAALARMVQTADPKERARLNREILDLSKKLIKLSDKSRAAQLKAVYQTKKAEFAVTIQAPDPQTRKTIGEGIEIFARMVGPQPKLSSITIEEIYDRSYYLNKIVSFKKGEKAKVVAHELAHWLEESDPRVHQEILAFFNKRTAGDREELLSALTGQPYAPGEKAKKDKWLDPYIGKIYENWLTGDQDATEVLSMGIEMIYDNPLDVARRDPEFFDFIIELLRKKRQP